MPCLSRYSLLVGCMFMMGLLSTAVVQAQDAKGDAAVATAEETAGKFSGASACETGSAGGYPCSNVHLISFLPLSEMGAGTGIGLNDAWGWVDPETDQRWALMAREDGVAFVEITDPASPRYAGELLKPSTAQVNVWRDVKVDGWYAFVVADGSSSRRGLHGMQVFDLRRLRQANGAPVSFEADAHYTEFSVAHNLVINEESDRAYVIGSRVDQRSCNSGLHIVDISDPLQPVFEGCFADRGTGRQGGGYVHDAQCVIYRGPDQVYQGREICVGANETAISIADVTDPDNVVGLSRGTYPSASYVHQGWFTEDQRYFIQNDELDERVFDDRTHTYIWDLQDLDDPVMLTEFVSDAVSTDHNLYVRGDFVYQANYSSGLRILDVSDPGDPFITGFFDTRPNDSGVNFNGAWTAWPFPDSDLVIISSRGEGLFVVRPAEIIGTRFIDFELQGSPGQLSVRWSLNQPYPLTRTRLVRLDHNGSEEVLLELQGESASRLHQAYSMSVDENVFRVQVQAEGPDGGFITSEELVVNTLASTHLLDPLWPNPAHAQVRSRLAVARSQQVQVAVHDALGRERMRLFEGRVAHDRVLDIDADASRLEPGTYYLRVVGEQFSDTRPFVVGQ